MGKVKIVDRTLSCLDEYSPTRAQLLELISLFMLGDADCLELSVRAFRTLGELPRYGSFVLRIDSPDETAEYPMFDKFVCPKTADEAHFVYAELPLNDVSDQSLITRHQNDRMIRIAGLDTLFRQKVETSLTYLKTFLPKNNEFAPGNSCGCAVAAAMEWINAGCGNTIVTSFGGVGDLAPFEEVLIASRHVFRRHPQTNYEYLPRMREIMEEILGRRFALNKPVIGTGIFTVESGIHIGGILKHPKCYELYPPETVGQERTFRYGKFSGRASIRHRLKELGVEVTDEDLNRITGIIKQVSAEKIRPVTEDELEDLIRHCLRGEKYEGEKADR
jgi:homocitrate synthase NifV